MESGPPSISSKVVMRTVWVMTLVILMVIGNGDGGMTMVMKVLRQRCAFDTLYLSTEGKLTLLRNNTGLAQGRAVESRSRRAPVSRVGVRVRVMVRVRIWSEL